MKCKWGDIISLEYGKPVLDKDKVDGAYPVFGTNGQIGSTDFPPLCSYPSVIIGRKGAYRGVHYSATPFSVIDTAFYVKRKTDELDLKWAYYKLLTYDINRMDSGSAIPSTDRYEIYSIPIILPPLPQQKAVAATLSALDDKIANNTKINQHLEQMAQAIFKSWFVDFEPWGGVMPSDWREGTISELGYVIGGSTPSKAKLEYYTEHGIAWITPKDLSVNKNKFITHGANDITELGLRNSSTKLMPRGTVLFSSRAPIGYIAIAGGEVSTNQGFKSIVPYDNIGTAFIYYLLIENLTKIENMASGSTFKEISSTAMKNIRVIIPNNEIIHCFKEYCTPLFEQQELLEQENRNITTIRNTLLPQLMSAVLYIKTS